MFHPSMILSFRISQDFSPFCGSMIQSFRIWGIFSAILPFHHSVILAFRVTPYIVSLSGNS